MSGVDQERMEMYEMGLHSMKDTYVCSTHIDDYAVHGYIKRNAIKGICTYCKGNKKVVSLKKLMFFLMEGVHHFYTDAVEFMSYDSKEGGYQGSTYTPYELVNELIGLEIDNYQLNEDIIDAIEDKAWSEPYAYYDSDGDILVYHWKYFKDVVKHKSRYLFAQTNSFKTDTYNQNAYDILQEIGRSVRKFKLISHLPKHTELFRCRQHTKLEKITEAGQIASPPIEYAIYPNRMSPAGVSMFYCAFDLETAKLETIDLHKKGHTYYTSACFVTKDILNIIDFSSLPKLPSIFDQRKYKNYYSIMFLREFVSDLSSEIQHDGKEHIEYVPTQIVTEFFRFIFHEKIKIDGIIYPSTKNIGSKACVLFFDNEASLEYLDFDRSRLKKGAIHVSGNDL